MAKLFSLVSWNLEHFRNDRNFLSAIIGFLREQNADVIGIYELNNREAFREFVEKMPMYRFYRPLPSTAQSQEIIVASKWDIDIHVTKRIKLQASYVPGASFYIHDCWVYLLCIKPVPDSAEFGLWRDIFRHPLEYKKWFENLGYSVDFGDPPPPIYWIFIGSLNAMEANNGLDKTKDLGIELTKLDRKARKYGIRRLTKNSQTTFWKGPGSSKTDLDQVLASNKLMFHSFSGADIDVRGWPKLATERDQVEWIRKCSYHGLVYFELENVKEDI